MDVSRLLMVLVVVISTLGGKSGSLHTKNINERKEKGISMFDVNLPDENITWYKNGPDYKNITTDEAQRIHYHGGALFLLNISDEDSGNYTAKQLNN
uniref:Ig-like domain-containing protein n=1 Tax=Fundulus heteroclitus TaxID=8078 RepID=A0A3Q2TKL1_FUNHE